MNLLCSEFLTNIFQHFLIENVLAVIGGERHLGIGYELFLQIKFLLLKKENQLKS